MTTTEVQSGTFFKSKCTVYSLPYCTDRLLETYHRLVGWGHTCNNAFNLFSFFTTNVDIGPEAESLSAWVINTSKLVENEILKYIKTLLIWKTVATDEQKLKMQIY